MSFVINSTGSVSEDFESLAAGAVITGANTAFGDDANITNCVAVATPARGTRSMTGQTGSFAGVLRFTPHDDAGTPEVCTHAEGWFRFTTYNPAGGGFGSGTVFGLVWEDDEDQDAHGVNLVPGTPTHMVIVHGETESAPVALTDNQWYQVIIDLNLDTVTSTLTVKNDSGGVMATDSQAIIRLPPNVGFDSFLTAQATGSLSSKQRWYIDDITVDYAAVSALLTGDIARSRTALVHRA